MCGPKMSTRSYTLPYGAKHKHTHLNDGRVLPRRARDATPATLGKRKPSAVGSSATPAATMKAVCFMPVSDEEGEGGRGEAMDWVRWGLEQSRSWFS